MARKAIPLFDRENTIFNTLLQRFQKVEREQYVGLSKRQLKCHPNTWFNDSSKDIQEHIEATNQEHSLFFINVDN